MSKLNSISLYVTLCEIILKAVPSNPTTWKELYRLAPYLRNSLCCVVCGNLLIDPLTPTSGKCQHHLCRKCKGGRKKIKPACVWCKDCNEYSECKSLRSLLQCYKMMCVNLTKSEIFQVLTERASQQPDDGAFNLLMLIQEGAIFEDNYKNDLDQSKSMYSILPCIYTNPIPETSHTPRVEQNRTMLLNTNPMYSSNSKSNSIVLVVPGTSVLRKPPEVSSSPEVSSPSEIVSLTEVLPPPKVVKKETGVKVMRPTKVAPTTVRPMNQVAPCSTVTLEAGPSSSSNEGNPMQTSVKKPANKYIMKARRGCRCGNATATPGKLTCCGQRCPCYADSKACMECKCRGCRNPHRPDGNKVRPVISHIDQIKTISSVVTPNPPISIQRQTFYPKLVTLNPSMTVNEFNNQLMVTNIKVLQPFKKVPMSLPHAILVNDQDISENEDEEITVDD
ncbi:hypothetical protein FQA39_LY11236 [Lamprigera yunnana]|nr:hypothetical protein FQA39_LY11236 [Lamprigera yunnana]